MNSSSKNRIVGAALLLAATAHSAPTETVRANEADHAVGNPTNDLSWLDSMHNYTFNKLQGHVTRADALFAETEQDKLAISNSTFELEINMEIEEDQGVTVKFDPRFEADLNLPNMENRWKVFLNTIAPDELSGTSPTDQEREVYTGLTRVFKQSKQWKLDSSAGIKWEWPPIPFAKIECKYLYKGERWKFYPRQRVFWIGDEGFGEKTSLQIDYWRTKRTIIRSDSAGQWSEESRGLEWAQSLSLGYIIMGDDQNLQHVLGARVSAFGHYDEPSNNVDNYRLTLLYRMPFLRDWMFIKFVPEAKLLLDEEELEDDEEERMIYSFRIGIDMLFSGQDE